MDGDELLKNIDEQYLKDEFKLDKLTDELPADLTCEYLLDHKSRLDKLVHGVSRKMSELILSRQPTYVDELKRIADLQQSIDESIRVCTTARSCLKFIKDGSSIVSRYRRREHLAEVLKSLSAIRDLRIIANEIRRLIDTQEDLTKAIDLCKQGRAILNSLQDFECVKRFGERLKEAIKLKIIELIWNYRFDEFIENLNVIESLIHISNEFCGQAEANELRECLNSQSISFFKAYHKTSMDELKMFLENELWHMVPVKSDFKLAQLREFSFLRPKLQTADKFRISDQIDVAENIYIASDVFELDDDVDAKSNVQLMESTTLCARSLHTSSSSYTQRTNKLPLDKISLPSESDDDEDIDAELLKDSVEEDEFVSSEDDDQVKAPNLSPIKRASDSHNQNSTSQIDNNADEAIMRQLNLVKTSGPVLTNSSLSVLRIFGRYIQMMSVLEPISYEILLKIYGVLDYYTIIVYQKFEPEVNAKQDDLKKTNAREDKIRTVIRSIRESLVGQSQSSGDNMLFDSTSVSKDGQTKQTYRSSSNLSHSVSNISDIIKQDLAQDQIQQQDRSKTQQECMDPKKAVAIESLIYLVNQLWNLQEYLESLIPAEQRAQLREQFSSQCQSSIVPDFLRARAELDTSMNA